MTTNHENAQKGNYNGRDPVSSYIPPKAFPSLHGLNCAFKSFAKLFSLKTLETRKKCKEIPLSDHASQNKHGNPARIMLNNAIYRTLSNNPTSQYLQYNQLITMSLMINAFSEGLFNIIYVIRSCAGPRGRGKSFGAMSSNSKLPMHHPHPWTSEPYSEYDAISLSFCALQLNKTIGESV